MLTTPFIYLLLCAIVVVVVVVVNTSIRHWSEQVHAGRDLSLYSSESE